MKYNNGGAPAAPTGSGHAPLAGEDPGRGIHPFGTSNRRVDNHPPQITGIITLWAQIATAYVPEFGGRFGALV